MKYSIKHSHKNKKTVYLYAAAVLLLLSAACLGVLLGGTRLSLLDVWNGNAVALRILCLVRLPRTLSSLLCGAALAVAGAVIQSVLANRLASPSIIGVNAGASLAVTVCAALSVFNAWAVTLSSFLGAFLSVLLIALFVRKRKASRATVILCGVALNSFLNAISLTVVTLFPDSLVMSNDFKIGGFSAIAYSKLLPAGVLILLALAVLFLLARELDVIGLGEETARGLGMNVTAMRIIFLLLAALLAGAAVCVAGLLSFVGLVVPHALRLLGVRASKHLLPLCALFGGAFVTLCDVFAKTAFAPYELPVGIVLAFVGAPFFLVLLLRRSKGDMQ